MFEKIKRLYRNQSAGTETGVVTDVLLRALMNHETITRDKAMTLPAVSANVNLISDAIASMPVRLYKCRQGKVTEVEGDARTRLLNGDTGDTLNGYQLKKALVEDFLLDGNGYACIERSGNAVTGLYYVDPARISYGINADPVHKYISFRVGQQIYRDYEVIKLLRGTRNGASGTGLLAEVGKALETAYATMVYQLSLAKSGGSKRGFLKSARTLGEAEKEALKSAWVRMHSADGDGVVVLNNGLDFQEAASSSVEMQLDQNKNTLRAELNSIFHVCDDFQQTFKQAIYPIVKAFEAELNNTLLRETEKSYLYFEFDVKELLRANVKERYEAYGMALQNGWKTINEVRTEENMNTIPGMDVLNIGLSAMLYDAETGQYYTPNTGTLQSIDGDEPQEGETEE